MKLLNVKDVAERLRISTRQVWQLNTLGKIPAPIRLSRSVRWRETELRDWLDAGCPSTKDWNNTKEGK